MKNFDALTEAIVQREGGFVNDPDDPGGATNFGVTLQTLRAHRNDPGLRLADIQALTRAEAVEIFETNYLRNPGIDLLPIIVAGSVYDMQVNSGARAVKLLQSVLSRLGHPLAQDGKIGPITLGAVRNICGQFGGVPLRDAYSAERREFYYRLGDTRPKLRKYCRKRDGGKAGWIIRAEDFLSEKWHFSPDQHQERIAQWQ